MAIYQGNTPVACNYNIISGALIDDSVTDATNKTWSAKKINESIPNSDDFVQNLKMSYKHLPILCQIFQYFR